MKGAAEGDDAGALGGGAGDLDGVLRRLGPGGEEHGLGRALEGGELVEPLAERDIGLIGQHLEGRMGEALELLARRGHHLGVAVAGIEHRDAAGEVDIALALDIPDLGVLRPRGIDAGGAGHAPGNGLVTPIQQLRIRRHGHSSPEKAGRHFP